jgi:hypothetical protein
MAATTPLSNANSLRCLFMSPLFDESKGSRPGIGTNGTSAQAISIGWYLRSDRREAHLSEQGPRLMRPPVYIRLDRRLDEHYETPMG